jgi:RNA polymerase sigma-70 factor (ECF subfamily)
MKDQKEYFLSLYEPVHQSFERFCKARAYGKMPFKDLMQETILIAFSKLNQVKEQEKFLFFLFGIAVRVLANDRRKVRHADMKEVVEANHFQLPESSRKSDVDELYKSLSLLPADQRDALVYFEIVGFSIREIADFQNKSEEAVRKSLSRGRQRLCALLKENDESKISAK